MSDNQTPQEPEDLIRYDVLAQEALRGVVRKVLQEVARTGLPGDHHFYVTFETSAQGVRMSTRMREKYPEEMTIVVQHQFWDLETTEHSFSIGLSFDNVPESLLVPFSAVRGFFDPSVQFGLQFDAPDDVDAEVAAGPTAGKSSVSSIGALPAPSKSMAKSMAKNEAEDADGEADKPGQDAEKTSDDAPDAGAEVVSLDAFRKK